ncbi:MAG: arylsulfatase [Bryobacteraceae bacterium]
MAGLSRRQWLGATAAGALQSAGGAVEKRPNVILIMSDDQGYGDLSLHGNKELSTPHLDRLAGEGAEFTRFYVSPVCAPTRSSLLTGRYNVRCGVHGVTTGKETMPVDEVTVAETFRGAGYRTALIGKWHLGEAYPNVPHAQGFDHYIGFRTGHWNNYFDTTLERNGKPYPTKGYIADALTGEAEAFVAQNRRNPFFLYLSYNTPHSPFQAPDRYWKKFDAKGMPREKAAVYGMIENLDDNIGRLTARLEGLGLAGETIVVFLTDNGPAGERYNAGLRGRKGSVYEGGVRVPFFLRWPGHVRPGRKVDTIAAHIDVYPTLADLCGVARAEGRAIDGRSLRPLLEDDKAGWPDRPLFTHRELVDKESAAYPGAIRTQRYNLVNGKELYDMEADPGESKDVAAEHPEAVRELRGRYEDWFQTAIAERGFHRLPIPVGHPEENPVTLPATQAYFDGAIRFNNGNGFAHDWLVGWTESSSTVHWEIDVAEAGRYGVTIQYLCPAGETGAVVGVEAGEEQIRATVERATSMDALPDRNLVFVKHYVTMDWGRLAAGAIELRKGRTRLVLRAIANAGGRVMDVKGVELRRLPG